MATISIVELALSGDRRAWSFESDSDDERVPLREIIRWQVREQVAQHRLKLASELGRLAPDISPAERALNGPRAPKALAVDWEREYERALEAVAAHQVVILVNDHQEDDLDTLVSPGAGCEVTFLRLTPLVGG